MGCGSSSAASQPEVVDSNPAVPIEAKAGLNFDGHADWIKSVDWAPNGTLIATGGDDHMIMIWEATTGRGVRTIDSHSEVVWTVKFNHESTEVASCSGNVIKIHEIRGGLQAAKLDDHGDMVFAIEWDPRTSERLWSASLDGTVQMWHILSGKSLKTVSGVGWNIIDPFAFSISTNMCAGTESVVDNEPGHVKLWSLKDGGELNTLSGHHDAIAGVAFSVNGKFIASSSWDTTAKVWNPETGECIATLTGHQGNIKTVVFSHDERTLVTCSYDKTARLWDVISGKLLQTLTGPDMAITCAAFSPDSSHVVIGSDDKTVRVFEVASGRQVVPPTKDIARASTNTTSSSDL